MAGVKKAGGEGIIPQSRPGLAFEESRGKVGEGAALGLAEKR